MPKGQQKLTTFSDLIEEGLSYLQLFLELPETIWSLQNRLYIKKCHFLDSMSGFVLPNLTFGLIYLAYVHFLSTMGTITGMVPKNDCSEKYDD